MRPAREISMVPIVIPAAIAKCFTIGRNEAVANAGASSVIV